LRKRAGKLAATVSDPFSDAKAALQALRRRKQDELLAENLRVRTGKAG
jgi:hypothetical protein